MPFLLINMPFILYQISSSQTVLNSSAPASLARHLSSYMAAAQVDAAQVEEFTKPSEETTVGSPTIEGSEKAPATQNIESPYDEDDAEPEDVILPDELGKEEEIDDEEDRVAPQTIEDDDDEEDEDEEEQAEEPATKSSGRATDFSEEEDDD